MSGALGRSFFICHSKPLLVQYCLPEASNKAYKLIDNRLEVSYIDIVQTITKEVHMTFFKDLSPEEEAEYRKWARDNYKPLSSIEGIWHPVVQDECIKINKEQ